jgi:hypothetical protein
MLASPLPFPDMHSLRSSVLTHSATATLDSVRIPDDKAMVGALVLLDFERAQPPARHLLQQRISLGNVLHANRTQAHKSREAAGILAEMRIPCIPCW